MNVPDFCVADVVRTAPSLSDGLLIHQDPNETALEAHADAVIGGLGRREKTAPFHPERILSRRFLMNVLCLQINAGNVAGGENGWLSAEYLPGGELELEARLPVGCSKRRRRNCIALVAQKLCPRDKVDLRFRKFCLESV